MKIVYKKKVKDAILRMIEDEGLDIEDIEYIDLTEEDFKRGMREGSIEGGLWLNTFPSKSFVHEYCIVLGGNEIKVRVGAPDGG